ncbi:MAG: hypothetical protein U5N21_23580 [Rhodococcus sp. (in: high G+C Gram-positive bacteria)]|nr:hypothetical protein [Rhodococcus sp. (in: high G+C Gram-positive bacteria)]
MASATSSEGDPVGRGPFVDPLTGIAQEAAADAAELRQVPRGAERSYHGVDVRREVYVPPSRLHELPQWPAAAGCAGTATAAGTEAAATSYVHAIDHPQWRTGFEAGRAPNPRVHTRRAELAVTHVCVGCRQDKDACTCASCQVCLGSIGKGSRHHCRRCWAAVCGGCRKRQRRLNAMAWVDTLAPVCDRCAVPQGLAHLTEDPGFAGITLLKQAMDAPLQCVAPAKCGAYTYRRTCPSCSMPTVPTRPHVERLVRIEYCCSMGRKCQKCASAEQRMKAQERETEQARYRRFDALTPHAARAAGPRGPGGGLPVGERRQGAGRGAVAAGRERVLRVRGVPAHGAGAVGRGCCAAAAAAA